MDIGSAIKTIRKSTSLNQGDLAKKLDVSQAYLSNIETGRKKPSFGLLEKIAKTVNVPLPILFWLCADRNDVSEEKRIAYDILKPALDSAILEIFMNN